MHFFKDTISLLDEAQQRIDWIENSSLEKLKEGSRYLRQRDYFFKIQEEQIVCSRKQLLTADKYFQKPALFGEIQVTNPLRQQISSPVRQNIALDKIKPCINSNQYSNQYSSQQPIFSSQAVNFSQLLETQVKKHESQKQKLMVQMNYLKDQNTKFKRELQNHRIEKVDYEEKVYELKRETQIKSMRIEQIKIQFDQLQKELRQKQDFAKLQIMAQNGKNKVISQDQPNVHEKNHNLRVFCASSPQLQAILSEMKTKLFHYEKQLFKKQALNNHQNYHLQRLQKQLNEFNTSQISLLQELQYVLEKRKKLKKQYQELLIKFQEQQKYILRLQKLNKRITQENLVLTHKIHKMGQIQANHLRMIDKLSIQKVENRQNSQLKLEQSKSRIKKESLFSPQANNLANQFQKTYELFQQCKVCLRTAETLKSSYISATQQAQKYAKILDFCQIQSTMTANQQSCNNFLRQESFNKNSQIGQMNTNQTETSLTDIQATLIQFYKHLD